MAARPSSISNTCSRNAASRPDPVKGIVTNIAMPARDGAFMAGGFDFAIFNEPNMSKMEKATCYPVAWIGKEVGRADYTVFFAKKS